VVGLFCIGSQDPLPHFKLKSGLTHDSSNSANYGQLSLHLIISPLFKRQSSLILQVIMGFQKARKAYYDAPEGQVHYRYLPAATKNESKAPILLLHQSACSSVYYKEMIAILASKGHDVYAPDMPG